MSNDSTGSDDTDRVEESSRDDAKFGRVPDAEWVKDQRDDASAAGAGLQFGLTICIFALVGLWLDGKFDTGPWLLVVGVILAVVGGTVSLLKKFG